KIKIYLARCTFCSQCNDVCPVNCLSMSNEFLLADTDKYSKDLIVE
ncbi:MAG: 4Fe-4S binding protein, partial [Euryarchaeota archaeon]|nr:4Fe-4S binding protein [Euryarchaeota archaeon]